MFNETSSMVWIWLSIIMIAIFCVANLFILNKILKKREQDMAILSSALEILGNQQETLTKNVDQLRKQVKLIFSNENKEAKQRYRKD